MIKLIIDPGHGGKDSGAVGNGLKEKNLNFEISKKVVDRLSAYEVNASLTRTADIYLLLKERCNIANNLQADYFCSIHINAGGGTGFESYVHTKASQQTEKLRQVIHNTVAGYYKKAGFPDRGGKKANFAVLRDTRMPAVLLENLFIDSPNDSKKLKDSGFIDGLAKAITSGLVSALGIPLKPLLNKTPAKVEGKAAADRARSFLHSKNVHAPDYIDIYIDMGKKYGLRWDAVFAQSCKETAFWKFGGDVKPGQNNFCGLGTFGGKPGASFESPSDGIEAQFQHWHVYFYGGDLPAGVKDLDPRRNAVLSSGNAGKLQYVEDLGGRWAPSKDYGDSIVRDYLAHMLK